MASPVTLQTFTFWCPAGLHTALTRFIRIFKTYLLLVQFRISKIVRSKQSLGLVNYILFHSFQYLADFSFWPGRFRNIIAHTFVLSFFPFPFHFLALVLSCSLSPPLSLSQGHKNNNEPLILKVLDLIFVLSRTKHIMRHFFGLFKGALTFLALEYHLSESHK